MTTSFLPRVFLACAVATTAMLAGCQATVDARSTTASDTVYRWEHALPTLPVEVRGQWPDASGEQLARVLPHAVPTPDAAVQPVARLVVEAGMDSSPRTDAYCATPHATQDQANAAPGSRLTLSLTLCDGTRLVASSRSPLDVDKAGAENLPRQLDRLKNLLLIGIDESPAQYVHIQS